MPHGSHTERSAQSRPVGTQLGPCRASHTGVSAPSSGLLSPFIRLISVRTRLQAQQHTRSSHNRVQGLCVRACRHGSTIMLIWNTGPTHGWQGRTHVCLRTRACRTRACMQRKAAPTHSAYAAAIVYSEHGGAHADVCAPVLHSRVM